MTSVSRVPFIQMSRCDPGSRQDPRCISIWPREKTKTSFRTELYQNYFGLWMRLGAAPSRVAWEVIPKTHIYFAIEIRTNNLLKHKSGPKINFSCLKLASKFIETEISLYTSSLCIWTTVSTSPILYIISHLHFFRKKKTSTPGRLLDSSSTLRQKKTDGKLQGGVSRSRGIQAHLFKGQNVGSSWHRRTISSRNEDVIWWGLLWDCYQWKEMVGAGGILKRM